MIKNKSREIIGASDLIIASSGTVTLEASLLKVPTIACYKMHPLTNEIAKRILKGRLKFFTLPNIIANKRIIPELAQKDASARNISQEALKILDNKENHDKIVCELGKIRTKLGKPGVITKAAKLIAQIVGDK